MNCVYLWLFSYCNSDNTVSCWLVDVIFTRWSDTSAPYKQLLFYSLERERGGSERRVMNLRVLFTSSLESCLLFVIVLHSEFVKFIITFFLHAPGTPTTKMSTSLLLPFFLLWCLSSVVVLVVYALFWMKSTPDEYNEVYLWISNEGFVNAKIVQAPLPGYHRLIH